MNINLLLFLNFLFINIDNPNHDGLTLWSFLIKLTWSFHLLSVVNFLITLFLFIFLILIKLFNDLNWLKPIADCISVGLKLKPELINKKFDILPEIIEKNPDFVKYYLDGEEREQDQLPLRFGMLPDGEHDLRIYANDIIGNDIDKTFSFTVDNTPPEILIKSPTNGTTVSHSLNIDFF